MYRSIRWTWLIIGISICFAPLCYAEILTLEKAIDIAIEKNPDLKATQAKLGVSQAEVLTAGARLNPSIVSDNGIAEKTYRVGIEQTFELGGKRGKRIALAKAQHNVVASQVDIAILDLRTQVRKAYTQLYSVQEREKVYAEIVETTLMLLDTAEKRELAGDIAKVDVLGAKIVMTSAKNDFQKAASQLLAARNSLNILLNQPIDAAMTLAPPTSIDIGTATPSAAGEPLDELLDVALLQRPELKQNDAGLEASRRELDLAKTNRVPNLTLTAGPDIVRGSDSAFSAFVIANMELPVFNQQQGPIQESLARQAVLEKEREAMKMRITLETTNAYTMYVANQERIKRYEAELLPEASQIVSLSRLSFQEGKASILTPLNAQQAYIDTRLGYLQALEDYQNTISDLERAIGAGL